MWNPRAAFYLNIKLRKQIHKEVKTWNSSVNKVFIYVEYKCNEHAMQCALYNPPLSPIFMQLDIVLELFLLWSKIYHQ